MSKHWIWRWQTIHRCFGWTRPASPRCLRNPSNPHVTKRNMFDPSSILVGLEIGTSKVCAVVGEAGANGSLNIIGVGQARSRGVRKGEIADASAVADDV